MLLRLGGSLSYLLDLSAEITDRVCLKVMDLVEAQMRQELGPPPATFAWMALGAAGRGELAPPVDLDFALIHADLPQPRTRNMNGWCHQFAGRLAEGLALCGLPPKKQGLSAVSPTGCRGIGGMAGHLREMDHRAHSQSAGPGQRLFRLPAHSGRGRILTFAAPGNLQGG